MKRKLITAALTLALLTLMVVMLVWLRPRAASVRTQSAAPASTALGETPLDLGSPSLPIADASAYAGLLSPETTARDDVLIVAALVQNFLQAVKGASPPLGFNEEITRALTGRNALELAFIPSDHPAISKHGLLCDRWGTPFHFHPVAADRIDVRSAGADRKLFTRDDIVNEDARRGSELNAGPVRPE